MKTQTEPTKLQNLLPVGLYKLSTDVTNPKPDRRANQHRLHSFRQWVVWPAKLPLICDRDMEFGTVRVYPQGGLSTQALREDEITAELLSSMVRVEEKASDYLIRLHMQNSALEIIDRIGVNIEQIDEIIRQIEAEEDQED